MGDVIVFPHSSPEHSSNGRTPPRKEIIVDTSCPIELLNIFLDMAQRYEIVFIGVQAVRKDGTFIQAATGLVGPEEPDDDPDDIGPDDDVA